MKVIIAATAEADIEAIGDHIAQSNPTRALTFILELRDRCFGIAETPLGYAVVRKIGDNEIRRRVFGNYLIFYRVHFESLEIIRVLHGAMDYEQILFPEQ